MPLFRPFRIWVVRNMCGCWHFWSLRFSVNSSEVSQSVSQCSIVAPLLNLCRFCGSRQFLGVPSSLRSVAGLEDVLDESFCSGVEDELVPEFVDNPGTTGGTKVFVSQRILFRCLVRCGFWLLVHALVFPCSSQIFPSDRTAGVSSSNCIVTKWSKSWAYTCASSFVCTSPLGRNHHCGVPGSPQIFQFFWAQNLFAQHVHRISRIYNKIPLLGFLRRGCRHYPNFGMGAETCLYPHSWACKYFSLNPMLLCAHLSCCHGFVLCSSFKSGSTRIPLMGFTLLNDILSRFCLWCPRALGELDGAI